MDRTETEDSPPGPPPGEGAALFSLSPEKEQIPTSPGCPRQGRFVDFLDDLGPGWDAGGATLLREARRTGQGIMVHHAGAGVLDRLGLLLYCRELLGKALNGVAEQSCLGDGGVEKACLVNVLHLYQVEPEMALLDHHGGHRLPEGPASMHQPRVGTTLMHLFERLGLVNLQNSHACRAEAAWPAAL